MRSARPETVSITLPSPYAFATSVLSVIKSLLERLDIFGKWRRVPKRPVPILLIIAVLGILLVAKNTVFSGSKDSGKVTIKGAKATASLGYNLELPIRDDKGQEVTKIKYALDTAELRDEIIVQGKKATLVAGKTYLILAIKITNNYDKAIEINVRDFVRLSTNGNDAEWTAADVHNDPVNIRAQSTRLTRIGYTVNDSDKNLRLRVGEISGAKQIIALKLL